MNSTTHDFYVGRGPDADWIGSVHLDACACHDLEEIRQAGTADEFTELVSRFLHGAEIDEVGEVTHVGREWAVALAHQPRHRLHPRLRHWRGVDRRARRSVVGARGQIRATRPG